ncbi:OTU deubiquitinase with linear linkage specificity a [Melanotaenia boesemani]|uniref:OTU deubiquitinase with linear linkage specificity a n=1 Tax=Melanotaenia boesemani TaxID=1250792 RepID=UPI001C03F285|nr:OTU deubiquitinase with linear linkage specificity a [Melanotaenia boesemani]
MSWVKSASSTSEDVFDENADELNLQTKEWTSNMKKRIKDGYVDGIDAGQEASLQVGFNQGFREGAAQTVAVGRLKGIISAIWCWCRIQHPENPIPASVTDLLQRVTQHEDQILNGIRKALENPPPSVSDISESMEDLEVEKAPGHCAEGCKESDCCRRAEIDLGDPHQLQHFCSGSNDCSSEDLNLLLQHCIDLVSELGLPHGLIGHIEELRNMK